MYLKIPKSKLIINLAINNKNDNFVLWDNLYRHEYFK